MKIAGDIALDKQLDTLKRHLREVEDLRTISRVLQWDQAAYLPPAGAADRGRQLALLERLAHERFTDPVIGHLLDALTPWAEALPAESSVAALVRVTRREYERAVRIPPAFAAERADLFAKSYDAWSRAYAEADFAAVRPFLDKFLALRQRQADFFPGYDHVADPLIDETDPGLTVAVLRPLFTALREGLVPLVRAIAATSPVNDGCLRQVFPVPEQRAFGKAMTQAFGFDFQRGRQDESPHPFAVRLGRDDVRITTRFREDDLGYSLFGTLHETGHALYEQGIDPEFDGTALGYGASYSVHESQARLWENIVGRGRSIWESWYPRLQEHFPRQLGSVTLDQFYRAINRVQPSLIRTEADEVTYNLHVIIRFDLELELLEGTLAVAELPEAWRARYAADLGIEPSDDRDGVLQDVHWFCGLLGGAFQGYALGDLMATQIYARTLADEPSITAELSAGRCEELHRWLREHLHRFGARYEPAELIQRIAGEPLQVQPHLDYLNTKFGELYSL